MLMGIKSKFQILLQKLLGALCRHVLRDIKPVEQRARLRVCSLWGIIAIYIYLYYGNFIDSEQTAD